LRSNTGTAASDAASSGLGLREIQLRDRARFVTQTLQPRRFLARILRGARDGELAIGGQQIEIRGDDAEIIDSSTLRRPLFRCEHGVAGGLVGVAQLPPEVELVGNVAQQAEEVDRIVAADRRAFRQLRAARVARSR
jgi:hypothetical protein